MQKTTVTAIAYSIIRIPLETLRSNFFKSARASLKVQIRQYRDRKTNNHSFFLHVFLRNRFFSTVVLDAD